MSTTKQKSNVPYVALYRRWRPQLFSQIVGQQHVTRTLQNALSSSRVAHAYLFCGLRGTGKTTMAKLLAKALNCEKGVAQEPCNACRSCREINEGNSLDVIEIDAASNRGIDEIRELREKIRYAAASSRYKVYIIDEVHMLTNEAFNALLKTLEEPPPNVVFILATTEVHKLPLTVVSRCQRFEFHLIEAALLASHLARISQEMNFSIDEETCTLLARLAEGSARDALGLLEQCRAYGGDGVNFEEALEILGIAHPEMIYRLLSSVAAGNIGEGLDILAGVVNRGKDVHRLLRELILYLRKLLLLQSGENAEQFLVDVPGFKSYLLEQRKTFSHQVLLEMLEILQQLTMQMKGASQPQFLLELAYLRLVRAYRFRDYLSPESLFQRLEELESKLETVGLTLAEHGAGQAKAGVEDLPPWALPLQQAPPVAGGGGSMESLQDKDAAKAGEKDTGGDKGALAARDDQRDQGGRGDRGGSKIGKVDKGISGKTPPVAKGSFSALMGGETGRDKGGAGEKGSAGDKKGTVARPAKGKRLTARGKKGQGPSFTGLLGKKGSKTVSAGEPPHPLPEPPPPAAGDESPPDEWQLPPDKLQPPPDELPLDKLSPAARSPAPQDDAFVRQVLDLFQGHLID